MGGDVISSFSLPTFRILVTERKRGRNGLLVDSSADRFRACTFDKSRLTHRRSTCPSFLKPPPRTSTQHDSASPELPCQPISTGTRDISRLVHTDGFDKSNASPLHGDNTEGVHLDKRARASVCVDAARRASSPAKQRSPLTHSPP